jgi:hypothetical protein
VPGDANASGRGTAPALVAAAQIDNGTGGAGICGRCKVMPVHDIAWAIDHGADVIELVDCAPAADIAAAIAHGVQVIGCGRLAVGDPPAVTGIAGLMLSCNPALMPGEIRQILVGTSVEGVVDAYTAVKHAGCRANPAEIVRLMVAMRGRGTVSRRPDDDTYNAGTVVVLRAKASPGWRFARWQGVCHGKRPLCSVRLMQSGVTTAVFRRG